jgi:hypothetical protein
MEFFLGVCVNFIVEFMAGSSITNAGRRSTEMSI